MLGSFGWLDWPLACYILHMLLIQKTSYEGHLFSSLVFSRFPHEHQVHRGSSKASCRLTENLLASYSLAHIFWTNSLLCNQPKLSFYSESRLLSIQQVFNKHLLNTSKVRPHKVTSPTKSWLSFLQEMCKFFTRQYLFAHLRDIHLFSLKNGAFGLVLITGKSIFR